MSSGLHPAGAAALSVSVGFLLAAPLSGLEPPAAPGPRAGPTAGQAPPAPIPAGGGGGGGIIDTDLGAPAKVPKLADIPALKIPKRAGERALHRVPEQRRGSPFAVTTVGLDFAMYMPSSETRWPLPLVGETFSGVTAPTLSSLNLAVGSLHLFNRLDLYVSLPLWAVGETPVEDTLNAREVKSTYLVAAGAKYFPLALASGLVRPYLSAALARRKWTLDPAQDSTASFERAANWVLPLGVGVAWRADPRFLIDAQLSYPLMDSMTVYTGVNPQPLTEPAPTYTSRKVELGALMLTFAVRYLRDLTPKVVQEGFRRREARRLARRMRHHTAGGLNLSVGPGVRLIANGSDYFEQHRPFLADAYDEPFFADVALGWYDYRWDAEARLAWRSFTGDARGYGASMQAGRQGFFVEAIKHFDLGYFGFVPWIGLGLGYELVDFTDTATVQVTLATVDKRRTSLHDGKFELSIPLGFDMRPAPTSWWLLRTALRWIPSAKLEVARDVSFDYGGLEFDFLSLVVFPSRL